MAYDLDRLQAILLGSGLQRKDNSLFQVISTLIVALKEFQNQTTQDITAVAISATPGGVDGNVQFNDNGSFNGGSDIVYDKATRTFRIGNQAKTTYKVNIVGDALTNQNLLGLFTSNLTAPAFDIFIDGGGNGVWRVIDAATVVRAQISANGNSFFAGGYVGFTGGFAPFVPSAFIHIGAGGGFAPLKFTSNSLMGAPQIGTIEYDGTLFYYTDDLGVRHAFAASGTDYVVASDGATPVPAPIDDGFGNFVYIPYIP